MVYIGTLRGEIIKMNKNAQYLRWLYRRNLLTERGAEDRKGIIAKLNRKIRKYEKENM